MLRRCLGLFVIVIFLFHAATFAQQDSQTKTAKIEVLIVDGFSNHNWQQTTAIV